VNVEKIGENPSDLHFFDHFLTYCVLKILVGPLFSLNFDPGATKHCRLKNLRREEKFALKEANVIIFAIKTQKCDKYFENLLFTLLAIDVLR
jgi:hypothetical protein